MCNIQCIYISNYKFLSQRAVVRAVDSTCITIVVRPIAIFNASFGVVIIFFLRYRVPRVPKLVFTAISSLSPCINATIIHSTIKCLHHTKHENQMCARDLLDIAKIFTRYSRTLYSTSPDFKSFIQRSSFLCRCILESVVHIQNTTIIHMPDACTCTWYLFTRKRRWLAFC